NFLREAILSTTRAVTRPFCTSTPKRDGLGLPTRGTPNAGPRGRPKSSTLVIRWTARRALPTPPRPPRDSASGSAVLRLGVGTRTVGCRVARRAWRGLGPEAARDSRRRWPNPARALGGFRGLRWRADQRLGAPICRRESPCARS